MVKIRAYLHHEPYLIVLGLLAGSPTIDSVKVRQVWVASEIPKDFVFLDDQRLRFRRELLHLHRNLFVSYKMMVYHGCPFGVDRKSYLLADR